MRKKGKNTRAFRIQFKMIVLAMTCFRVRTDVFTPNRRDYTMNKFYEVIQKVISMTFSKVYVI